MEKRYLPLAAESESTMTNPLTPERLQAIKARCEATTGLCENCAVDRLCCTCINAPWQLTSLPTLLAEVERLTKENDDMADTLECCTKCGENFALADGKGGYIGDEEL